MKYKISKKELLFDLIIFGLSCMHTSVIYVFMLVTLFKIREGSVGFIKINMLFLLRQCVYFPGISSVSGTQSTIKLFVLAALAGYLIVCYLIKRTGNVPICVISIVLFGLLATASAWIWGSYPLAGVIKAVAFALVFIATVLAVMDCQSVFDAEDYLYQYLCVIVLVSCLLIPFSGAYMVGSTGKLFRGIWNHPNDFGVICAIYLSVALVRCDRIKGNQVLQILLTLALIFLSKSRGAMIAAIGNIVIYYAMCREKKDKSKIIMLLCLLSVALVVTPLGKEMVKFFAKNSGANSLSEELFSSRDELYDTAMFRFKSNLSMGRGLLIPYYPGLVTWSLDAGRIEPGNIFIELLAGTGIIGMIAFMVMLLVFFVQGKGKKRMYILVAVLASISEVSFFSVNNYAFVFYLLIGLSLVRVEENTQQKQLHAKTQV